MTAMAIIKIIQSTGSQDTNNNDIHTYIRYTLFPSAISSDLEHSQFRIIVNMQSNLCRLALHTYAKCLESMIHSIM